MIQAGVSAHCANGTKTTKHDSKTNYVETNHTEGINQEVHCECMSSVLRLSQSRLYHCETRLHKHDQKSSDQGPHHIYCNFAVSHFLHDFVHRRLTGFGCGYIGRTAGVRAAGIVGSLLAECDGATDQ